MFRRQPLNFWESEPFNLVLFGVYYLALIFKVSPRNEEVMCFLGFGEMQLPVGEACANEETVL